MQTYRSDRKVKEAKRGEFSPPPPPDFCGTKTSFILVILLCRSYKFYLSMVGRRFTSDNAYNENNRIVFLRLHQSEAVKIYATSENTIILFVCPPKLCISIVSSFSCELQWSQEKTNTILNSYSSRTRRI